MIDFSLITDQLADPVVVCDEDGIVVYANPPALELIGEDDAFFDENPADSWLWGSDGLLWPPTGDTREKTLTLATGGRQRRVRAIISPLPVDGGWGWLVQLRRDPSEERLVGMKAVAGVIAEQLGGHLRTIVTNASEALMSAPLESQARWLRAIHASAQSAAGLQRQVAALGAENDARRQPSHLGAMMLDAERNIQVALAERTTLVIDVQEDQGQVLADPDSIGLMLAELAAWAADLDDTPEQLHLALVPVPPDRIRVQARLVGTTLRDAEREHVFEPRSGARLGLALVYAVVTRHGGRVLVESGESETTLYLEFPFHDQPARRPRQEPGTETVLVVEDDPSVLEWVQLTLRKLGYNVLTANNGIAASVLLRERHEQLDLLLTDAVLPGRSGPELIAESRAIRPNLPVLLMSGYSEEFLGEQLSADVGLLRKPFGPSVLAQRMRELLDH